MKGDFNRWASQVIKQFSQFLLRSIHEKDIYWRHAGLEAHDLDRRVRYFRHTQGIRRPVRLFRGLHAGRQRRASQTRPRATEEHWRGFTLIFFYLSSFHDLKRVYHSIHPLPNVWVSVGASVVSFSAYQRSWTPRVYRIRQRSRIDDLPFFGRL